MNENIIKEIASSLKIRTEQVEATLNMLQEGNTIPFIARYRKKVTGALTEEQIKVIEEHYSYQVNLLKRKEDVIRLIEEKDLMTEELRDKIMPINKAYKLPLLMDTIKEYIEKTNRRVTIEYVMLQGVNDQEEHAIELAQILRGLNVYVNLIPYNETNHIEFKSTSKEQVMKFYDVLKKKGINVTIRKEFGGNIDAACGQLRSKEVKA